jgi:hypothetical protein
MLTALSIVLFAGLLARNAILAGWLLYPAPVGKLNVDWAVPEYPTGKSIMSQMQSATGQYNVVRAWASVPDPQEYRRVWTEGFSFWFPNWCKRWGAAPELQLLPIGAVFLIVYFLTNMPNRPQAREYLDFALVAFVGLNLFFWFWLAPDLRFGYVLFWIWTGLGASMLLTGGWLEMNMAKLWGTLFFLYLLTIRHISFIPPGVPNLWHLEDVKPRATIAVPLQNGQTPPLTVHIPAEEGLCGDAPIPCTPYPRNSLKMRRPGDFRYGFKIEEPDNRKN